MSLARLIRMIAALVLAGVLLETANWAVRDCSTGPSRADDCFWLRVQARFGLPTSKLLRAGVLELTGLAILAGLWVVFYYVWPRRAKEASGAPANS